MTYCPVSVRSSLAYFLLQQTYVIMPLLPATIIPLWIIVRTFGNARLLLLYDQLEQSTTPFDDSNGVDEFDAEAPAPVKEVKFQQGLLSSCLNRQLLFFVEISFCFCV
jgi:hypothetical protein